MAKSFIWEDKNSDKKILAGTVKSVGLNTFKGQKQRIVRIEDPTGVEWSVFFSNREDPSAAQMADRVERAKVNAGSFITVIGYFNSERHTGNGWNFMFRGIWPVYGKKKAPDGTETEETEVVMNVIMGNAQSPKWRPGDEKYPSNRFEIDIPVTDRDENTTWNRVTFYDFENRKRAAYARNMYPEAKDENDRVLRRVAVLCGPLKTREYNGKVYHDYSGYTMVIDTSSRAAQAAAADAVPEPVNTAPEMMTPEADGFMNVGSMAPVFDEPVPAPDLDLDLELTL